jgi:hypothetical protein
VNTRTKVLFGTAVVAAVAIAQLLSGAGGPTAIGQTGTTTTTAVPPPGTGPLYHPAVYRANPHFFLRNNFSTGVADAGTFQFGDAGDSPLMCDWNGDGIKTPGVRRGITFYIRNSNTPGNADEAVAFGNPTDTALCGDWDGDGKAGVGVWRAGEWFLLNRTTPGTDPNARHFFFGNNTDQPIVGNWNGDVDRSTTAGVKRGFQYFLVNSAKPTHDITFFYGNTDDKPVVGDFDRNNTETVGIMRPSTGQWYLANDFTGGNADVAAFGYGNGTDTPLTWSTKP